ncbi:MAG: hypothetical protein KTR30_09705 [Saprospiraceae bacterium]|nr:hypothetical protein [Saprospiraceae bacterium]
MKLQLAEREKNGAERERKAERTEKEEKRGYQNLTIRQVSSFHIVVSYYA